MKKVELYQTKTEKVMSRYQKAVYYLLLMLGIGSTLAFGAYWFMNSHIPHNFSGLLHSFDFLIFALLSYVVWFQIINEVFSWDIALGMKRPKYIMPPPGFKVAFLTAFVPGKESFELLRKTLTAMTDTDYPHDTWVLDEGKDLQVKILCKTLKVKYFSRFGKKEFNRESGQFKARTKAGNYNAWFAHFGHKYDIVAQLDVDFIPKTNFLTRTLGYFTNPEVGFVGTPQIYGNKDESAIAQGAAEQAYNFYGSQQKGLFGRDMTLLIGANHLMRTVAHKHVGGYAGHIVEDHLTGMKFYSNKWKSVYVAEALAIGQGPVTWQAYFNQQMRWSYGLFNILFKHSMKLFKTMQKKHVINYFVIQQYYFYGLAQGISVVLLFVYFLFGFSAADMPLKTLLGLYIPVIILQQIIAIWLQRFNVQPQVEKGILIKGRLLSLAVWPIYLISLINVLSGKKLQYKVTPKGRKQTMITPLSLFFPHFVLGTLTLIGLIASIHTGYQVIHLVILAIFNTVVMYGVIMYVILGDAKEYYNLTAERLQIKKFIIPYFSLE